MYFHTIRGENAVTKITAQGFFHFQPPCPFPPIHDALQSGWQEQKALAQEDIGRPDGVRIVKLELQRTPMSALPHPHGSARLREWLPERKPRRSRQDQRKVTAGSRRRSSQQRSGALLRSWQRGKPFRIKPQPRRRCLRKQLAGRPGAGSTRRVGTKPYGRGHRQAPEGPQDCNREICKACPTSKVSILKVLTS